MSKQHHQQMSVGKVNPVSGSGPVVHEAPRTPEGTLDLNEVVSAIDRLSVCTLVAAIIRTNNNVTEVVDKAVATMDQIDQRLG